METGEEVEAASESMSTSEAFDSSLRVLTLD